MNDNGKHLRVAHGDAKLLDAVRRAARQEQFLEVVSAEEARARFERHLDLAPLAGEIVPLAAALGRVLSGDMVAASDVPPFDRANVDGFAVAAADTVGASDATPRRLALNAEVLVCGRAPTLAVAPRTATTIATGGVVPRGADAVVMIEQTELVETPDGPAIDIRRAVAPGAFVASAGSDIARGEALLRRGAEVGSRELGMLAACDRAGVPAAGGADAVPGVRRPTVAGPPPGDELEQPGEAPRPGAGYDCTAALLTAAIQEAGGEPVPFGAFADDEAVLAAAVGRALDAC